MTEAPSPRRHRMPGPPRYVQISTDLRRKIEAAEFPPGALLPPEPELCRQYGVARQTLRQAVEALVRDGLLARFQGRGTMVLRRRIAEQPFGSVLSIGRALTLNGMPHRSEILEDSIDVAQPIEQERLGLDPGERIYRLRRLRIVSEVPFSIELIRLPAHIGEALAGADLRDASLYDLIEARAGVIITRAYERVRAVGVEQPTSGHLRMASGAPALEVDRTGYAGQRIVEWRINVIRGDRAAYVLEVGKLGNPSDSLNASPGHLVFEDPPTGT